MKQLNADLKTLNATIHQMQTSIQQLTQCYYHAIGSIANANTDISHLLQHQIHYNAIAISNADRLNQMEASIKALSSKSAPFPSALESSFMSATNTMSLADVGALDANAFGQSLALPLPPPPSPSNVPR
jgi:methyl-accepting chemotaxis protein